MTPDQVIGARCHCGPSLSRCDRSQLAGREHRHEGRGYPAPVLFTVPVRVLPLAPCTGLGVLRADGGGCEGPPGRVPKVCGRASGIGAREHPPAGSSPVARPLHIRVENAGERAALSAGDARSGREGGHTPAPCGAWRSRWSVWPRSRESSPRHPCHPLPGSALVGRSAGDGEPVTPCR